LNESAAEVSKFRWQVRVYYEDTDLGGVVYYANYLKFMERARTEWLRDAGVEQDALLREHGLLFVITACDIRYHAPARFNDRLDVTVVPVKRGKARFKVAQQVLRDGDLLVEARIDAACIDAATFRPRAIPDNLLPETVE
jgi:acyl-CoA thioester hydrolase